MKIVCASLPGPGHAHPMLTVARALAQRGHEVVFASGEEHDADAARAGATSIPLPPSSGSPLHALRPYEDSASLARATAPLVAALGPDVMVVDLLTLGAGLAAEMNDVPWASLLIHGLHLPSRELPPFGWGAPPGRGIWTLRDAWMRRGNLRDLTRARDHLNAARTTLGLEPVAGLDGMLSPDLLLVATLPSLEIPRADWPPRAHVIGPCLWDAPGGAAPGDPQGDGPIVLIAASTARSDEGLVEGALDAVAALGVRAIVTLGTATAHDVPPTVTVVRGFADHDAILPRCAAVICNGGHGIVARALTHGVPLVVRPGHGDQRENGFRVERAGAGLRVLRADRIAGALGRVLAEPAFARRAREIAAEAAGLDGPATAARLVEEMVLGKDRAGR